MKVRIDSTDASKLSSGLDDSLASCVRSAGLPTLTRLTSDPNSIGESTDSWSLIIVIIDSPIEDSSIDLGPEMNRDCVGRPRSISYSGSTDRSLVDELDK